MKFKYFKDPGFINPMPSSKWKDEQGNISEGKFEISIIEMPYFSNEAIMSEVCKPKTVCPGGGSLGLNYCGVYKKCNHLFDRNRCSPYSFPNS